MTKAPGAELAAMRRTETKTCSECGTQFTGLVKTKLCKRCSDRLRQRKYRLRKATTE